MALIGPTVRQAKLHEFPAVVSIINRIDVSQTIIELSHICTGTLVSRQDVLTAEHCIRDTFVGGFKIMYGSSDLHEATEIFPVYIWTYKDWIINKQKTLNLSDHDIAFIKLLGSVAETIEFSPVGNIENRLLFGLDVVTAGWGRFTNETKPRHLHALDLKILTKRECQSKYYNLTGSVLNLDIRLICTVGNPYGILYKGDSGGPLFFFGTLIAINYGGFPRNERISQRHLINLHYGLRYYHEFYEDITTNFRVDL